MENDQLIVKTGKKSHTLILCVASIQIAISFLLEWTPNLISLVFLGQHGDEFIISAFGLGLLWSNVFGFGFLSALASGLETMTSQAYGSKAFKTTSLQFWQCQCIVICLMIPITLLMYYSDELLIIINGKEDICRTASVLAFGLLPSIYLNGVYSSIKGFLNGQNVYNLTLIAQIVTVSLHILWCYIFITTLEYDIEGAILARSLTEILNLVVVCGLIKYKGSCNQTLQKFDKNCLKGWGTFLKQAVPIGLCLWLEWLSYEMYSFQASWLANSYMAASILMNNFSTFYFQFAFGISIATTTFIGNCMGDGNSKDAKKYFKAGMSLTIIFVVITQSGLGIFRKAFAGMFTNDPQVQAAMLKVFIFFCVLMAIDSIQAILTGTVRGIGHEKCACYTFLFFYLIFGQVVSYCLTQVLEWQLAGILIGMISGTLMYTIVMLVMLWFVKWDRQAISIQNKMNDKEVKISLYNA